MLDERVSNGGFMIKDKEHGIFVKSKGFNENVKERKSLRALSGVLVSAFRWTALIVSILFSINFLSCSWWVSLFVGIICGLSVIYFVDLLFKLMLGLSVAGKKDFREYHACAHRVINLLESESMLWAMAEKKNMPGYFWDVVEKNLTIENLRSLSFLHEDCSGGYFFIQKRFALKEPSGEKLEEALEVAWEYCRRISA